MIKIAIGSIATVSCTVLTLTPVFSESSLWTLSHCSEWTQCLVLPYLDGLFVSIPILSVGVWLVISGIIQKSLLRSRRANIIISLLIIVPLLKYVVMVFLLSVAHIECLSINPSGTFYGPEGTKMSCWNFFLNNVGVMFVLLPLSLDIIILLHGLKQTKLTAQVSK